MSADPEIDIVAATDQDPLEFIDFVDVIEHGDPGLWKFRGPKEGSPIPPDSQLSPVGTMKHYDLYEDEFGTEIELHYFRHVDGSVSNVKITKWET